MGSPCKIMVTGDYSFDYNLYLDRSGGDQLSVSLPARLEVSLGGAGIIHSLLSAVAQELGGPPYSLEVGFAYNSAKEEIDAPPTAGLWEPQPLRKLAKKAGDEKPKVWRLTQSLSLRDAVGLPEDTGVILPKDAGYDFWPDILVVEDDAAGYRFDTPFRTWHRALTTLSDPPQWIILKMTAPLCQGDLWRHLTKEDSLADRLVVVLSVEHLRLEDVRISKGISWERTVADLVRGVKDSPALTDLKRAKHVIITLDGDGALWMSRSGQNELRFSLFFDPQHLEEEWTESAGIRGGVYGLMSCFTGALAARLAIPPERPTWSHIESGIIRGLELMRFLKVAGHGLKDGEKPGFLFNDMAAAIITDPSRKPTAEQPSGRFETKLALACRNLRPFAQTVIPCNILEREQTLSHWHILEGNQDGLELQGNEPLFGIAKRVAIFGPKALIEAPVARFGKLLTPDRDEIESLNNLKLLIKDYDDQNDDHKPLSLAAFGPPGAGKSFGIKQIALEILGEKTPFLEFNLSQFNDAADLIGAFHQVRDKVLEGHMPVVFWDEFDSGNYRWLQYMLAPMQDGKFQEGQITHPIGKCVFVFAGATSYTFENFGPEKPHRQDAARAKAWNKFKLYKGPDFKSRLHGFINVLGPNRRQKFNEAGGTWKDDSSDVCFPVRRALLLRSILKAPHDRLRIDRGLLSALMEVDLYYDGARSFEKIVRHLHADTSGVIHRSSLPSDEIMRMNVDTKEFSRILTRSEDFQNQADKLAPEVHEFYRRLAKKKGWKFKYDIPYEELPPEIKANNVAAALRIPWILELAGLFLVPEEQGSDTTDDDVSQVLESLIDVLAEEEHDLWMEYNRLQGWRQGEPRKDADRIHDCLIPYRDLKEADREKDRNSVRAFPEIVPKAGFKISRRKPGVTGTAQAAAGRVRLCDVWSRCLGGSAPDPRNLPR
ncbi:MAG: AAA family ATPase [Deltaproteobacteria bacterium]|nr:AAA family ATPase [Deltaproteobacteria bacterium]